VNGELLESVVCWRGGLPMVAIAVPEENSEGDPQAVSGVGWPGCGSVVAKPLLDLCWQPGVGKNNAAGFACKNC